MGYNIYAHLIWLRESQPTLHVFMKMGLHASWNPSHLMEIPEEVSSIKQRKRLETDPSYPVISQEKVGALDIVILTVIYL